MKLHSIAGKEYALGLTWSPLLGESLKAEVREVVKERKSKFGILRASALQVGVTGDKSAVGKVSAAGQLADKFSSAIAILELSQDQYWLCAVSRHGVIPGFDVTGTLHQIRHSLVDILEDFDSDGLAIFADAKSLSDLGIDLRPVATVSEFFASNADAADRSVAIRSLETFPARLAVLFVLTIACGAVAYNYLVESPLSEGVATDEIQLPDGNARAISDIVSGQNAEEAIILERARKEELSWISRDLEQSNLPACASALSLFVRELPKFTAGWALERASRAKASDSLVLTYQKGPLANTATLESAYGDASISFALDGKSAEVSVPFHCDHLEPITDPLAHIDAVVGIRKLTMDALDLYGFPWAMAKMETSKRAERIAGVLDAQKAEQPQIQTRKTQVAITAASIESLSLLSVAINRSWPITLASFDYLPSSNQFSLTGEIYE